MKRMFTLFILSNSSPREINFLAFQLVLPGLFNVIPLFVYFFMDRPSDEAFSQVASGTLILIAALSAFSLGQDILHSVKPYNRVSAERVEKKLQFLGLFLIAIFAIIQTLFLLGNLNVVSGSDNSSFQKIAQRNRIFCSVTSILTFLLCLTNLQKTIRTMRQHNIS